MKKQISSLKNDQRGVASIVISVFVILILSLVVLDMSRDSNREQRQALDRQLSSQAFYAAESGINDTVRYFTEAPNPRTEKTNCDPWQGANQIPGFSSSLTDTISYTCVLYETELETLHYDNVSPSNSQIIPIEVEGGTLGSLEISWKATDEEMDGRANRTFTGCGSGQFYGAGSTRFPKANEYPGDCDAGFLRAELVDFRGGLGRNALINNTFVGFMVPRNGGALTNVALSAGQNNGKGIVREAQCSASDGRCRIRITGLNLSAGDSMYLRVNSVYKAADIEVDGILAGPTGEDITFVNAQAIVDVTGKATDVLKRLQVRVPLGSTSTQEVEFRFPEFVIQSNNICKQLQTLPPSAGTSVSNCD